MQDSNERDLGSQPLDRMMDEWGMGNHDVVSVSTEQLTHKQVQKARKGRRLTLKMMQKVSRKKVKERPRSPGDGSQRENPRQRNFVHIVSPTSRSVTGARSVLPVGPRIGPTGRPCRRSSSRSRRCAWTTAS